MEDSSFTGFGTPTNTFPWCQCKDYRCACSPYTLEWASSETKGILTKTCFKVNFRDCDRNLACCRGLLAHVDKVNLDSTAACAASKNNIRNITVNGKWWPSWNTYKHDKGEAGRGGQGVVLSASRVWKGVSSHSRIQESGMSALRLCLTVRWAWHAPALCVQLAAPGHQEGCAL